MMRYAEFAQGEGLNWWETDRNLQRAVRRYCTPEVWAWAEQRLGEFGQFCGTEVSPRADYTDRQEGRPRLVAYDRQGQEISKVVYNPGYLETVAGTFGRGIVAWRHGAPADYPAGGTGGAGGVRVAPMVTYAMGYMLSMAESGFYCPVVLTAAVALVLDRFAPAELRERYLPRVAATDPAALLQGATWLTEKAGGSDVGAIETVARHSEDGVWRLTGEKWFASNADAPVALALARPEGAPPGTAGLGLFLVPRQLPDGRRNSYRIRRLKEKLGVIAVPSGEVLLEGAEAYLIGGPGSGFKQMMEGINLSRVMNGIGSAGLARRAFLEAVIYTSHRNAFGKPLNQHPLMRAKLLGMLLDLEAITALVFRAADSFEKGEPLHRLLIPIAKARSADKAVQIARAALECFGGNGYIEEYVMARLLRDAQVLTVWEGPENVLALDLLRVLAKQGPGDFLAEVGGRLAVAGADPELQPCAQTLANRLEACQTAMGALAAAGGDYAQVQAVRLLNQMADLLCCAYLLEEAAGDQHKRQVAELYVERVAPGEGAVGPTAFDRAAVEHFEQIVDGA